MKSWIIRAFLFCGLWATRKYFSTLAEYVLAKTTNEITKFKNAADWKRDYRHTSSLSVFTQCTLGIFCDTLSLTLILKSRVSFGRAGKLATGDKIQAHFLHHIWSTTSSSKFASDYGMLPFWNSRSNSNCAESNFAIQRDFSCKMENSQRHIDKSE